MPKVTDKLRLSDEKLRELFNRTVFEGKSFESCKKLITEDNLGKFKVNQLKEILRVLKSEINASISLSGNKDNLIDRIKSYIFQHSSEQEPSTPTSITPSMSQMMITLPNLANNTTNKISASSSSSSNGMIMNGLQLKRQRSFEEEELLTRFRKDLTIEGKIDPYQKIENLLDIKCLHNQSANFSFDFYLDQDLYNKAQQALQNTNNTINNNTTNNTTTNNNNAEYEVHIHYFTHDPIKPKNWQNEYHLLVNGQRIDAPIPNRKLMKRLQKEILITSTPFQVKPSLLKPGNNTIEVRASYSILDGRLFVGFVRLMKTEELVAEITSKLELKHHLDIDDEMMNDVNGENKKLNNGDSFLLNLNDVSKLQPQDLEILKTTSVLLNRDFTKEINNNSGNNKEEEIIESDEVVPLRDPLELTRITVPAKGKHCVHRSCFELQTFLVFGHNSKGWNCPRCDKPIYFKDLVVDPLMTRVLKEVPEEVEKILLKGDGTYTIINDEQSNSGGGGSARKKKSLGQSGSGGIPSSPFSSNTSATSSSFHNEEESTGSRSPPFISPVNYLNAIGGGRSSLSNNSNHLMSTISNNGGSGGSVDEAIEID
ncbi:hypothetical protein ABK040_005602 [Willaertia magna]